MMVLAVAATLIFYIIYIENNIKQNLQDFKNWLMGHQGVFAIWLQW